jgi:lysyl-tRNA synthetase class II
VSATEERNYVEAARREKRAELERLGVAAFAYAFTRTHTAAAAIAAYQDTMGDDGPEVTVAGRIAALRSQGKTAFAHLEDESGRISSTSDATSWETGTNCSASSISTTMWVRGGAFSGPAWARSPCGSSASSFSPSRCAPSRGGRPR